MGSSANNKEAQRVREHALAHGCVGKSERKREREDYVFELEFRKMGETL